MRKILENSKSTQTFDKTFSFAYKTPIQQYRLVQLRIYEKNPQSEYTDTQTHGENVRVNKERRHGRYGDWLSAATFWRQAGSSWHRSRGSILFSVCGVFGSRLINFCRFVIECGYCTVKFHVILAKSESYY